MKRNKYIIAVLMCFFAAFSLVAQKNVKKEETTQVSAKVVDVNGKPIVGVIVLSNEGALQTTTDINGEFKINTKKGGAILIEQIGYDKKSLTMAQIGAMANRIVLAYALDEKIDALVNLPYQITKQSKTSGSIAVINADKELDRDTRFNIGSATNGKITGVMGQWDVHGIGNGTVIVDGVKRDATYLNMQEVESITVLKDAVSRMLYGSDADKGVFLVTTKNGASNKKVLKVNVEQGMQQAIAYPKFLNAADYMTTYNKAAMNDGAAPYSKFSQLQIDNTLNKVDPVLYPDNNYYSNDFVRNSTEFTNLYAEASGGSESAQYFMNMGLKHNAGWINMGQNDMQDVLNLRGKVKFDVNKWLNMNAEVVAVFDLSSGSNAEIVDGNTGEVTDDYWSFSSKFLPNAQTLLIPTSRVTNMTAVPATSIVDGKYLLGGSSVYTRNLQGDLTRSGNVSRMNRVLQVNTGFDMDLNKITKGLTAKGLFTLDFNNKYAQLIDNDYAVYAMGVPDSIGNFAVTQVGLDKNTNSQTVSNNRIDFNRTITGYAAINYNRTFGDHAISAVAMSNAREYVQKGLFQTDKVFNYGAQVNYVLKDKYIIDAGVLTQGSSKLSVGKKFASAPSFGAAWLVSNEDFLKGNAVVNYLKIRGSYGTILNDNFTSGKYKGYYLNELNYANGSGVSYGNGTSSNNSVVINSLGNNVDWQQRNEMVVGFESYLFNNKTWLEASYFNSESANVVTEMKNRVSAVLGGVLVFENYNTTVNKGFEVGIKHTEKMGDLTLAVGVNYMLSNSEITKIDEPFYNLDINKHLTKVGTASNSAWGLTAAGLYAPEDFDAVTGKLLSTLPVPTYGVVRAGDIKYVDYNKDNVIDANDNSVLGLSSNNSQYSFDIDLKYKNWQLYVLGIGQMGGTGYTNSNYYWFKGKDAKYSEIALKAYDPLNPNPNAEYPRLSQSNGTNNYINSTYWMYDRSYFSLSAVQLAYNIKFGVKSPVKDLKVFGRGSNLLTLAKDKTIQDLNYQLSPKSRVFALGLIASF